MLYGTCNKKLFYFLLWEQSIAEWLANWSAMGMHSIFILIINLSSVSIENLFLRQARARLVFIGFLKNEKCFLFEIRFSRMTAKLWGYYFIWRVFENADTFQHGL